MAQQFNRLTPHTAQILALKGAGASIAEIQRWLRARRIRVDESTIRRFWSRVHTQAPQSLSLPDFDAAAEVLLLKAQTKLRRKRCFNRTRSRLDSRTAEILALKGAGASIAEIQRWLRARRIRVDESTIRRFWSRVHTQAPQSLSLPDFDAAAEVLLLKAETKIRRKRCFNQTRSRLDSRTAEILAMKNAGLSAAKIQLELDAKGLTVDESTVWQFLKKQQGKYGLI